MGDYAKMKNSDLEALLKERGLPHNGRKAEMVARLQEADKAGTAAPSDSKSLGNPSTDQSTSAAPVQSPSSADDRQATSAANASPSNPPPDQAETSEDKVDGDETKEAAQFSANLATTSLDEEITRRKKRAEKFGMTEEDSDAIRNLERQKRFGTGPTVTETEGVNRLDEALPERAKKGAKRGRADTNPDRGFEDPGLKRQRGRGRGRGGRAPAPRGRNDKSGQGGTPSWMTDTDKAAAERRKAKFG
ncbi:MAG: hypothetical protein Q9159_005498 [Coniocarpon cinnabarinum]